MAQVGYGSITITDLTDTLNTQHFWWSAEGESEDVPGGAYITNTSIKEFKANPTGGNLLTRSDGLWLRNGVNKLVSLTAEGLSFYNPNEEIVAEVNSNGFVINNGAITFGEESESADGYISLANTDFSRSVGGIIHENLRLAIGENFGVASDGTLYATKAVFSGNVEINAGTIISKEAINSSLGTSDIVEDLTNLQSEVNELSALQVTVTDEQAKILGSLDFGVIEETPVLSIKADANSPLTMQLTNSELRFLENNNPVASISNQLLQIEDATIVNQLQFGDFAFIPRTNGNLALKYIGE